MLFRSIPQPVQTNASDAALARVWRHRRRTLSSDFDATGLGRSHHLGAGVASVALRRWNAIAIPDLYFADSFRYDSDHGESRA